MAGLMITQKMERWNLKTNQSFQLWRSLSMLSSTSSPFRNVEHRAVLLVVPSAGAVALAIPLVSSSFSTKLSQCVIFHL